MEHIPLPIVLDAERPRLQGQLDVDDANRTVQDLDDALRRVTDYGRHLWRQIDAVRHYLIEAAPDPDADDEAARVFAAPRGPDDTAGWERWKTAYEAVTMVLAGPAGDSGFGRHEAAQEALRRRGPVSSSDRTAELVRITEARAQAVEEQRAEIPVEATAAPEPSTREPSTPGTSTPGTSTREPSTRGTSTREPSSGVPLRLALADIAAAFVGGMLTGRRARSTPPRTVASHGGR